MPSHAGNTWKPSETQADVMLVLLRAGDQDDMSAASVGAITGQSAGGAARTLKSLNNRGLVAAMSHDGDRWLGYHLTGSGREIALDLKRARAAQQ